MCGEYAGISYLKACYQGSPPHVWGKLYLFWFTADAIRITPTCVGKTINVFNVLPIIGDHPHMCGENTGGADD